MAVVGQGSLSLQLQELPCPIRRCFPLVISSELFTSLNGVMSKRRREADGSTHFGYDDDLGR